MFVSQIPNGKPSHGRTQKVTGRATMRGDAYADDYYSGRGGRLGKPHRGAWRSDSDSDYTRDAILAGVVISLVCR